MSLAASDEVVCLLFLLGTRAELLLNEACNEALEMAGEGPCSAVCVRAN